MEEAELVKEPLEVSIRDNEVVIKRSYHDITLDESELHLLDIIYNNLIKGKEERHERTF